jgi:protein PhnA
MDTNRALSDCNGNPIYDGDTVVVIKSYPIEGTGIVLSRGPVIRNIKFTDSNKEVECRVDKTRVLIKTAYLKRG